MIYTTQHQSSQHPEFILESIDAEVHPSYPKQVGGTLETMIREGSVFKPGQAFQVGWMWTKVQQHADGVHLTLTEPDMQVMPMRFTPGITQTLRQMMVQLFILDSYGLRQQMDLPTVTQSLIACSHYSDPDFTMDRGNPFDPHDSGWYVGCTRENHDHNDPTNLTRISIFEAFLSQRGIQGLIGFPKGTKIIHSGRDLEIQRDAQPLQVISGTYLDAWKNRAKHGGLPPIAYK